jgi:general secretion pathway protein A
MHADYWSLREEPFQNIADLNFAYLSNQHKSGLSKLLYLVHGRKSGGVIVGSYGVGKSMLLYLLQQKLSGDNSVRYIQVDAPPAGGMVLGMQILSHLGYTGKCENYSDVINVIQDFATDKATSAPRIVLAVDEAHLLLEDDAFQLLHLLTNLRVKKKTGEFGDIALTLILSGHEEFLLALKKRPALVQRMQLIWRLAPLSLQQCIEYTQFRIQAAGGDIWLFEKAAVEALYRASNGLPRVINNICDVALLLGCAAGRTQITKDIMMQAIDEVKMPEIDNIILE